MEWIKIAERNITTRHKWMVTRDYEPLGIYDLQPPKHLEKDIGAFFRATENSKISLEIVRKHVESGKFLMAQKKDGPMNFSILIKKAGL
jgi:hypothetical protein|tara:strand:+ start:819 stop:1085 length:267 start_codon:yes stop_codon:yes gene_type:complete